MKSLRIPTVNLVLIALILVLAGLLYDIFRLEPERLRPPAGVMLKSEFGPITDRQTMDNYSFSVGVWCAWRLMNPNAITNINSHEESDLLHAARHFAHTNGWKPFGDREGFRGDE